MLLLCYRAGLNVGKSNKQKAGTHTLGTVWWIVEAARGPNKLANERNESGFCELCVRVHDLPMHGKIVLILVEPLNDFASCQN